MVDREAALEEGVREVLAAARAVKEVKAGETVGREDKEEVRAVRVAVAKEAVVKGQHMSARVHLRSLIRLSRSGAKRVSVLTVHQMPSTPLAQWSCLAWQQ